ncbi:O-antigen ligase family protein [Pontibacter liquoris]|uniref:O-antigen ligase family protein n=1 Tax=Pontibacter liquoris TaxID=2905677 RepID=UPI001FA7370B|nr:O-antigen ligase family protein [Pontibacter liquoris]
MVFWLGLFTIFTILSTLLYYPKSFLHFQFYRYDGNFFISYLPLLVLPFLSYQFDIEKLFKRFLLISTGINLLVYLYFLRLAEPAFTGLFLSTNGAGGFFSIVTSLAFLFFLEKRTAVNLSLLLLNSFFLFSTYSRGSILGLILGLGCLLVIYGRRKHLITLLFVVLAAIQVIILCYTYPDYKQFIMNGPRADINQNYNTFAQRKFGSVSTKLNNVYIRIYDTWPRAVDCFLHSPVVGTGFGSINDVPFRFNEVVPHLIATNAQPNKVFNDSHAHHSFLHILGEQGIVGLGLFVLFWVSVYNFLIRNKQQLLIRNFLLVSYFNLTIMSFTEHRITTPSNALPFVIMLGLYYLYVNYYKGHQPAEATVKQHNIAIS